MTTRRHIAFLQRHRAEMEKRLRELRRGKFNDKDAALAQIENCLSSLKSLHEYLNQLEVLT